MAPGHNWCRLSSVGGGNCSSTTAGAAGRECRWQWQCAPQPWAWHQRYRLCHNTDAPEAWTNTQRCVAGSRSDRSSSASVSTHSGSSGSGSLAKSNAAAATFRCRWAITACADGIRGRHGCNTVAKWIQYRQRNSSGTGRIGGTTTDATARRMGVSRRCPTAGTINAAGSLNAQ